MANRMVMQPIAIPASSFAWAKVSAIECGAFFTLALTETGGLFAWGQGLFGVLGQNNEDNRFTPTPVDTGDDQVAVIRAGAHHALYITGQGVAAALHVVIHIIITPRRETTPHVQLCAILPRKAGHAPRLHPPSDRPESPCRRALHVGGRIIRCARTA